MRNESGGDQILHSKFTLTNIMKIFLKIERSKSEISFYYLKV